jgi:hypothetical protein
MTTIHLEYLERNLWRHYGTYHHLPSATQYAQQFAKRTGKRFRIIDENGMLLDLVYPPNFGW